MHKFSFDLGVQAPGRAERSETHGGEEPRHTLGEGGNLVYNILLLFVLFIVSSHGNLISGLLSAVLEALRTPRKRHGKGGSEENT